MISGKSGLRLALAAGFVLAAAAATAAPALGAGLTLFRPRMLSGTERIRSGQGVSI